MLFPYFGGKTRIAPQVWEHLGDPELYIEPFAGSLAVLLNRPTAPRTEIAVDLDGLLINFWRCIAGNWHDMEPHFFGIVSEIDIQAKHAALLNARPSLTDKLKADDHYYDPQLAAWWWEGISSWLGSGYGHRLAKQRPHIDRSLKGVWATRMTDERITEVARRLGSVIILAGDWQDAWKRATTDAIVNRFDRSVGVFLDPPYAGERASGLYAEDAHLNTEIEAWCLRQPRHVKVVLAGYEDEYPGLKSAGWLLQKWTAPNGYAGKTNSRRKAEVLYVKQERSKRTIPRTIKK